MNLKQLITDELRSLKLDIHFLNEANEKWDGVMCKNELFYIKAYLTKVTTLNEVIVADLFFVDSQSLIHYPIGYIESNIDAGCLLHFGVSNTVAEHINAILEQ